jgi:elongation factor G
MKVEVTTPSEFMGDIIGDLSAKRGQIVGTEERARATIINAIVPLAEMSGYVTSVRSMSKGRATPYMEPSHYDIVPRNIVEAMLAKSTFTGRISAQS